MNQINDELQINYSDFAINCDFLFSTDSSLIINTEIPYYYVCPSCYSIRKDNFYHSCIIRVNKSVASDCLIGAIVVQEFLKILQKKKFLNEYQLLY